MVVGVPRSWACTRCALNRTEASFAQLCTCGHKFAKHEQVRDKQSGGSERQLGACATCQCKRYKPPHPKTRGTPVVDRPYPTGVVCDIARNVIVEREEQIKT